MTRIVAAILVETPLAQGRVATDLMETLRSNGWHLLMGKIEEESELPLIPLARVAAWTVLAAFTAMTKIHEGRRNQEVVFLCVCTSSSRMLQGG